MDAGATCLHLVDLDGARDGAMVNLKSIEAIVGAAGVPCELGGGIRDEASIKLLLGVGLSRLVIGTKALKEPDWFRGIVREFPGKLALGIDAKSGLVANDGWLQTSSQTGDRSGPAICEGADRGDHLHRYRA